MAGEKVTGWWTTTRVGLLVLTLIASAAIIALVIYMLVINSQIKVRRENRKQNYALS